MTVDECDIGRVDCSDKDPWDEYVSACKSQQAAYGKLCVSNSQLNQNEFWTLSRKCLSALREARIVPVDNSELTKRIDECIWNSPMITISEVCDLLGCGTNAVKDMCSVSGGGIEMHDGQQRVFIKSRRRPGLDKAVLADRCLSLIQNMGGVTVELASIYLSTQREFVSACFRQLAVSGQLGISRNDRSVDVYQIVKVPIVGRVKKARREP